MRYSSYPSQLSNVERDKIRAWMLNVLKHPQLSGTPFPALTHGLIMYCDGKPVTLYAGTWQETVGDRMIYLAGPSTLVAPLDRVAILATVARITQLNDDPEILNAVTEATVKGIKAVIMPVWDGLVVATERPTQMAFNLATYEVAAEMRGKWYLPSGQPVKVGDAWTIMEF